MSRKLQYNNNSYFVCHRKRCKSSCKSSCVHRTSDLQYFHSQGLHFLFLCHYLII